jgi:hypothetical protein
MLIRQMNIIHFQHDFHSQATGCSQPGAPKVMLRWQCGDGSKAETTGAIPQTRMIFFLPEHFKPKDMDIKRDCLLHVLHKQFKSDTHLLWWHLFSFSVKNWSPGNLFHQISEIAEVYKVFSLQSIADLTQLCTALNHFKLILRRLPDFSTGAPGTLFS